MCGFRVCSCVVQIECHRSFMLRWRPSSPYWFPSLARGSKCRYSALASDAMDFRAGLGLDVAAAPGGASGAQKRRRRLALPQNFVLYAFPERDRSDECVTAYCLVQLIAVGVWDAGYEDIPELEQQRCLLGAQSRSDLVVWRVGDVRSFPQSQSLDRRADSGSWKAVCAFRNTRSTLELMASCKVSALPRGFRVHKLVGEHVGAKLLPCVVTTREHCRAAGVEPPIAPLAGPHLVQPSASSAAIVLVASQPPVRFQAARSEASSLPAVTHRYSVRCLLAAWRLRCALRSGKTPLGDIVKMSAQLAFGSSGAAQVCSDIDSGALPLPAKDVLAKVGQRLNLMDFLWQRHSHSDRSAYRWLFLDSSPQGGYNFLVFMEDKISFSAALDPPDIVRLDLASNYTERHLPVTCLGYGAADRLYKTLSVHHAICLETGDWRTFCKFRDEVYGWTTDQGTESAIIDSPLLLQDPCMLQIARFAGVCLWFPPEHFLVCIQLGL